MPAKIYEDLLEVMRDRGGLYKGLDIPEFFELVEELFTPEEAAVNNALPRKPISAADLAQQMGRPEPEVAAILKAMADKGLCLAIKRDGVQLYQAVPLMPGIFEFQFMPGTTTDRDKKIAHLIQAYKEAQDAATGPVKMTYPTARVITVDRHIPAGNQVHTYDQVATYIDKYDPISVGTCFCRHAAALRGEDTHDMPLDVCMAFGPMAEYGLSHLGGRRVTKAEAQAILDRSEEAGLIHMSRNTAADIDFICNCDRWHCEVVTRVLGQPRPALFFNSGFKPEFDADKCTSCEICLDRCPAAALTLADEIPVVDLDRCFGCAACATGCPEDAILMEAKPDFPAPPQDMKALVGAVKASRG
ncbi:MAG: 4Fe-4S binding protein [Proteobacteria bacterium]|nr:4Fe-4S binding protein [Pseudomonadota bacterium]MBU1741954.1 4Fe-4S binding protein [Pseudomonadota bacterium]